MSGDVRTDKLKMHIMVEHKVLNLGDILTQVIMLNKDKRTQIIESLLVLKNRIKPHRYNTYHAAISAQKRMQKTMMKESSLFWNKN